MRLRLILLILIATATTIHAQERPDEQQQAVTNDDGGKAFIVKPFPLTSAAKFVAVDGDIEQHTIFLGSGWADPDMRAREPALSRLLLNIHEHPRPDVIEGFGIKNRFAPTFTLEKLDISGSRNMSDLEFQRVLAGMFKDGTLQPPRTGAIYLVFLDPDLHSTLGALVADKHYEAYHAFFNTSGARVHYIVLPFQPDLQTARQIALSALMIATSNSDGAASR